MIGIKFDTDELQKKLDDMAGQITGAQMGRSIALGINLTLRQARTQSDRQIRKVFNIRQSFILRYIQIKNAKNTNLVGDVIFPTKPIPMGEFMGTKGGKQSRGKGKARPIQVEIIRGQPKIVNGAFFLRSKFSPSGSRLSIMHRSNVTGGSSYSGHFQFRHKRIQTGKDLTIGSMFAPSPFGTIFNKEVEREIITYTNVKLMDNVFTMLDKMAAGYIKNSNNTGRFRP